MLLFWLAKYTRYSMTQLQFQHKKAVDRFTQQRFALAPHLNPVSQPERIQIIREITSQGLANFMAHISQNGLQQLWRQFLQPEDCEGPLKNQLQQLKYDGLNAAANALKDESQLRVVFEIFKDSGINAFIFKGGQLRRTIYADPSLRPVSDIDLFVPEARKLDAAKLLSANGFRMVADLATISHEASFIKNKIHIDLHWHLLRPGRTRTDLSDYLFTNREQFSEGLWGLNPAASLLVMLIHPAFTKHLISPDSMLIHMVDLHRLLAQAKNEWSSVRDQLQKSGATAAAWSSLKLLHLYSDQDEVALLAREVEPGTWHKNYLSFWIERDLVRRWFNHQAFVRFAFNLALQDSLSDAVNAVRTLREARRIADSQLAEFLGASNRRDL